MDYFNTPRINIICDWKVAPWPFCEVCSSARNQNKLIFIHCKIVNMAEPNGYIFNPRGKFSMKRKLEWKLNISTANKRRRIEISEKKESIVNGRRIVEVEFLADEMWCIIVVIMKITGHLKFARELAVELRCQPYWVASRYLRFLYNFSRLNMQYLSYLTGNECFFAFKIFASVQFT